eukprot:SM000068S20586  [mRNA]  locus=s68:359943:372898:- [translate_table: standard]
MAAVRISALALVLASALAAGSLVTPSTGALVPSGSPACPYKHAHVFLVVVDAGGPCSVDQVRMNASSTNDILSRTQYPANQTVVVVLQNDIHACNHQQLLLHHFMSAASPGYTLSAASDTFAAIRVSGAAHDILFTGVSVFIPITGNSSTTACAYTAITLSQNNPQPCPAIYIAGAFNVQITKARVYGRIDLHDAYWITIDSMILTSYKAGINVRVGTGCGNSNGLTSSNIRVTNNNIFSGDTGVLVAGSAVGVTISNNYCHALHWACVQIGLGIGNVADAQMNNVSHNYIVVHKNEKVTDAAGIYFATHWYNPGNYLSCNYVIGGEHCIYVDYASSGLTIDGAVCVNTTNGIKQNNGKYNTITSVLAVNTQNNAGWISCQNFFKNNCLNVPGSGWFARGIAKYPPGGVIAKQNPWYPNLCSQTQVNGIPCNPVNGAFDANVTANCSGLPTGNIHHYAIVKAASQHRPIFTECEGLVSVPQLNSVSWVEYNQATALQDNFVNAAAGDFGLKAGAPILATNPRFKSCPRSMAGPQPVATATYFTESGKVVNLGDQTTADLVDSDLSMSAVVSESVVAAVVPRSVETAAAPPLSTSRVRRRISMARFAMQFPEDTIRYKEELYRFNCEAEESITACYCRYVRLIEQSETTISQQDLAAQFLCVVAAMAARALRAAALVLAVVLVANPIAGAVLVQQRAQRHSGGPLPTKIGHHDTHGRYRQTSGALVPPGVSGGPCSATQVFINAITVSDILYRTQYHSNQTVVIVLQNNITLDATLALNSKFSCTMFMSAVPSPGYTLSAANDSFAVVNIGGRSPHNILFNGVSFNIPLTANSSNTACAFATVTVSQNGKQPCPAIFIGGAFDVQITQGTVYGRVDMHDASFITLDNMNLTSYKAGINVRVGTGCGNSNGLTNSSIRVTNNRIYSGDIGVLLAGSAVGVTVSNNYCHSLHWTCVQIGLGITNVADSLNHNITNNFILVRPGEKVTDAAGIYFATHWYNPGNYLSCNYIFGGEHCLYIDYASSGITIDGMVCVNQTNGIKENNGKHNNITSVVVVGATSTAGWISCQLVDVNNCLHVPGSTWYTRGTAKYPAGGVIANQNPWYSTICSETSVNGVECNPPGAQYPADVTGNCSGLPTDNIQQYAVVAPATRNYLPTFLGCQGLEFVPRLNSQSWAVYNETTAIQDNFLNATANDYGLKLDSPILTSNPDFKSCPKSKNGPKKPIKAFVGRLRSFFKWQWP